MSKFRKLIKRESHEVKIPIPPDDVLLPALDIESESRYIGMYWEPSGDEFAWYDGRHGVCGANWQGWLLWQRYWPTGACGTRAWIHALGSSEDDPTHMLVLDRKEREAYAMSFSYAAEFLESQNPPKPLEAGIDEIVAALIALSSEAEINMVDIQAMWAEDKRRLNRLQEWLENTRPAPGRPANQKEPNERCD